MGIRHLRTPLPAPDQRQSTTMLNGWAYGAIYRSSAERTASLDGWLFITADTQPSADRHPSPS